MIAFLEQFPPVIQALFGTLFTWAMTALGAAGVFLKKEVNHQLIDFMLGFAGGVMIAVASPARAPTCSIPPRHGHP